MKDYRTTFEIYQTELFVAKRNLKDFIISNLVDIYREKLNEITVLGEIATIQDRIFDFTEHGKFIRLVPMEEMAELYYQHNEQFLLTQPCLDTIEYFLEFYYQVVTVKNNKVVRESPVIRKVRTWEFDYLQATEIKG